MPLDVETDAETHCRLSSTSSMSTALQAASSRRMSIHQEAICKSVVLLLHFRLITKVMRLGYKVSVLRGALLIFAVGGELVVRNAGSELVFDWSTGDEDHDDAGKPILQWAAFYSDCEHEVYEVTAGHRITLTYNLYVTRGLGHLAGSAALNATQLPLYEKLQRALESPGFLRRGEVHQVNTQ